MISFIMKLFLSVSPKIDFSPEEKSVYDELLSQIYTGQFTSEELSYPTYRFLHYLSLKGDFVFHGSNNLEIDIFEPRRQTLFNGKVTKAIFASSNPAWSIFYAVFDRSKLVGSFRNGCIVYKNKPFHYYSLNKSTMKNKPWTSGMVYILPKSKFKRADQRNIHFDEWICDDFVKPINQLKVSAEDFYFLNKVTTHRDKESLLKTLLFYKVRARKNPDKTVESEH